MSTHLREASGRFRRAKCVLWDFDGVVKESVEVKTDAFRRLFTPFGPVVVEQVLAYHRAHGGVSRWEKIAYALSNFIDQEEDPDQVRIMGETFAQMVVDSVVNCSWVPGAEHLIRDNPHNQAFALVTGTPTEEIRGILRRLELDGCFRMVLGSPVGKDEAVSLVLDAFEQDAYPAVMIGDSATDWRAAEVHRVPFIWRLSAGSDAPPEEYRGPVLHTLEGLA